MTRTIQPSVSTGTCAWSINGRSCVEYGVPCRSCYSCDYRVPLGYVGSRTKSWNLLNRRCSSTGVLAFTGFLATFPPITLMAPCQVRRVASPRSQAHWTASDVPAEYLCRYRCTPISAWMPQTASERVTARLEQVSQKPRRGPARLWKAQAEDQTLAPRVAEVQAESIVSPARARVSLTSTRDRRKPWPPRCSEPSRPAWSPSRPSR